MSSFHAPAASRLRSTCSTPQNASSTSSWKDGRARRRCSNWPDIASSRSAPQRRPREQPRDPRRTRGFARLRRRDARARALPRPRVAAPRAWPCLLVEERVRDVELRLHVGLGAVGADGRRVGARAEQQADRLREDRLPRSGLARDRVQPRSESEIRLADQHEVLDAKPTKQSGEATGYDGRRHWLGSADVRGPRATGAACSRQQTSLSPYSEGCASIARVGRQRR